MKNEIKTWWEAHQSAVKDIAAALMVLAIMTILVEVAR